MERIQKRRIRLSRAFERIHPLGKVLFICAILGMVGLAAASTVLLSVCIFVIFIYALLGATWIKSHFR